jgi:hypothetical protein
MRCCLLALLGCAALPAQDVQIPEQDLVPQQIAPAPANPANDAYVPLTLWQNYAWSLNQIFGPGELFVVAARTAFDHSRSNPSSWGGGAEGYAMRAASRLGRVAVRQEIAFAVRALDHEDPRYFRSPRAGGWNRVRYAVGRTFVVRNERGGTMPAYSLLVADFATPFIAQTWRPEPIDAGRELRGGAVGIGFAVAGNLGREFWPDIRNDIRKTLRR